MKILYFTATGNSLYVAKKLGGQLLSIPQLVKAKVDEIEDDAVGVVYGTGVYKPGEIKNTPAFTEAYQLGRSVR